MLAFWILDPLYSVLGALLAWFYALIPSYGVAIILLTVAVRLVTFPLTAKQARSQQALQRLQPELKRLQAKYKHDRQKLNEEMMKFYRENKVNPFGGCLPLLIQMPVLIVLYRLILDLSFTAVVGFSVAGGTATGTLSGATVEGGEIARASMENGVVTKGKLEDAQVMVNERRVGIIASAPVSDGKIASAQVVEGETVVGTLTNMQVEGGETVGRPKHVPTSSALYRSLVRSDGDMPWLGMDLSKSAAAPEGSSQLPYFLLIAIVVATGYFQQRQISARVPKDGANAQMQAITKIFPLFFGLISFSIPAGVVVYFATSNFWQIGQQWFMFRNQPPIAEAAGDKKTGDKKPADGAKGGKGQAGKKAAGSGDGSAASKRSDAKKKASGSGKGAKQVPPPRRGAGNGNQRAKNARSSGRSNPARQQAAKKNPRGKNGPRKDN
ncbi:MAG: membrane protein insertase YidC [Actinomycetota bacterium]|nr:membrane protein insertase YidC [Actinomycetota bacterium]